MGTNLLVAQTGTTYTDTGGALSAGSPPPQLPYDFDIVKSNSNIVRARTLSVNVLEISTATAADNLSWTVRSNALTCHAGFGVALVAYGASSVDAFWFDRDGITLKTATSADDGATWGAASTVATSNRATPGGTIMLAAPAQNVVFWTDTNSARAVVRYSINSAGWQATQVWGFSDGVAMGIETPINILGSGSYWSSFDALALGTNDYLLTFYASSPRGRPDLGVYTMRVSGVTATAAQWQSIEPVHIVINAASAFSSQGAGLFLGWPKIQGVGSEYWITALESSLYAGTSTQHLCYLRSADGIHWSDRNYLAGSDVQYGGVSFVAADLLYAKLLVISNRTFFFSYNSVFRTQSTSLVGITNSTMQVDVTADSPQWSLSLSGAGQAGTGRTLLNNQDGKYNAHAILRRGARLIRKIGYITTNGSEFTQLAIEYIDELRQSVQSGVNTIEIVTKDNIKKLQDWVSDIYWEYFSGAKMNVGKTGFDASYNPSTASGFKDITPVAIFNGTFFVDESSQELHPGMLDTTSAYPDNFCIINTGGKVADGVLEVRVKCFDSNAAANWAASTPSVYFGIAFQCDDNLNYYAILYNKTFGKFTIEKARPTNAADNTTKVLLYGNEAGTAGSVLATSTAVTLNVNTYYWFRVERYHGTVNVRYSTDRKTWTLVSWASGSNSGLVSREGYWGFVATGNLTISSPVGNSTTSSPHHAAAFLQDQNPYSLGHRLDYAMRIQPSINGIVRGFAILGGHMATANNATPFVPDTVIALALDDGTGSKPADLTVGSNVPLSVTVGQSAFARPIIGYPAWPFFSTGATSSYSVTAGTNYWIWVYGNGNMAVNSTTAPQGSLMDSIGFYIQDDDSGNTFPSLWSAAAGSAGAITQANMFWITLATGNFNTTGSKPSYKFNVAVALQSNGPVISAFHFASSELPKSIEYITNDISAKSGVLSLTTDSQITDTFGSALGNDGDGTNWAGDKTTGTWLVASGQLQGQGTGAAAWGFLRSNTSKGTFGDILVDCDVTFLAASKEAGFILRATGAPSTTTLTGYVVGIADQNPNKITLYYVSNNTMNALYVAYAPTYFSTTNTQFHVQIVNNANYIQVYVNRIMVASWYDTLVLTLGYAGFAAYGNDGAGGAMVKFDNYRIPDLCKIKPYFSINARETAKAALDRLIKKDRAFFMSNFDDTLRIASFNGRTVSDTYSWQILDATKIDSDRYWASSIEPEGLYFARRWSASLVDSDGYRFKHEDYTDAQTDQQAWLDAAIPLRFAEEQSSLYQLIHPPIPAAQREDVITVTNNAQGGDGTNANYIINDIEFSFDATDNGITFEEHVGLRKFVS